MNDIKSCAQPDAVCLALTGQAPAATVEYVAVSASPVAASFQIVGAAFAAAVLLVIVVALVDWARK